MVGVALESVAVKRKLTAIAGKSPEAPGTARHHTARRFLKRVSQNIALEVGEPYERVSTFNAWYLFSIFQLVTLVGGVELGIVSLLVKPIESSLHVGDTTFATIASAAPAIGVVAVYYPSGMLADAFNRRNLIVGGVILWSIASFAASRCTSEGALFAARLIEGVGIGIVGPSMYSAQADSFPPKRRAFVVGLALAGGQLGAGLSIAICSGLVIRAQALGAMRVPILGAVAPWQLSFLAVCAMSVMLIPLLALIKEPRRSPRAGGKRSISDGFRDFVRYMRAHGWLWTRLSLGAYGFYAINYAVSTWAPTLAERVYHVPATTTAGVLGSALSIGGLLAIVLSGLISNAVINRGRSETISRLLAAMPAAALVLAIVYPLAGSYAVSMLAMAAILFFISAQNVFLNSAIQDTVPTEVQGQLVGVLGILAGLPQLLAPSAIGFLAESVFGGPLGLRPAFATVSAICVVGSIALLAFNVPAYRAAHRAFVATLSPSPDL